MEIWKSVKGYDGIYQISNLGRLKSMNRVCKKTGGYNDSREIKTKILKPCLHHSGYMMHKLSNNGTGKLINLHRIIAIAFILNPENKREVNHRDGNKSNNLIGNLEWATRSENTKHAFLNNLIAIPNGERKPNSKLKEEDVKEIRRMLKETNKNYSEISAIFNVSKGLISRINCGLAWKHIN